MNTIRMDFGMLQLITRKKADFGYFFTVNEGFPITLENIEVKDCITHVPESTNVFWEDLLSKKTFDQEKLENGIVQLSNFYQFQGFWDFKVVDKKFVQTLNQKLTRFKFLWIKEFRDFGVG